MGEKAFVSERIPFHKYPILRSIFESFRACEENDWSGFTEDDFFECHIWGVQNDESRKTVWSIHDEHLPPSETTFDETYTDCRYIGRIV